MQDILQFSFPRAVQNAPSVRGAELLTQYGQMIIPHGHMHIHPSLMRRENEPDVLCIQNLSDPALIKLANDNLDIARSEYGYGQRLQSLSRGAAAGGGTSGVMAIVVVGVSTKHTMDKVQDAAMASIGGGVIAAFLAAAAYGYFRRAFGYILIPINFVLCYNEE